MSVLHTWGSALTHHPHVHMVVPGGGLSPDGSKWIACRPRYFLAVQVLSALFRRLFLDARYKTMTLPTNEFIRRFLIHVLPKGFHRIRHYVLLAITDPETLRTRASCSPCRRHRCTPIATPGILA